MVGYIKKKERVCSVIQIEKFALFNRKKLFSDWQQIGEAWSSTDLVPINQKDKLVGRLLYFEANFKVYAFGYNVDLIPPLRVSSRGGFEALFCDTLIEFIFKGMLLPPHQQISMIQGEKVRKYSSAVNFINILRTNFFVRTSFF